MKISKLTILRTVLGVVVVTASAFNYTNSNYSEPGRLEIVKQAKAFAPCAYRINYYCTWVTPDGIIHGMANAEIL